MGKREGEWGEWATKKKERQTIAVRSHFQVKGDKESGEGKYRMEQYAAAAVREWLCTLAQLASIIRMCVCGPVCCRTMADWHWGQIEGRERERGQCHRHQQLTR